MVSVVLASVADCEVVEETLDKAFQHNVLLRAREGCHRHAVEVCRKA